jgi:hypothetical protein
VLNHLQRDCLRVPSSQYAYIAPTYKQAKRVAWDMAKHVSQDIPGAEYNESELTVRRSSSRANLHRASGALYPADDSSATLIGASDAPASRAPTSADRRFTCYRANQQRNGAPQAATVLLPRHRQTKQLIP